MAFLFDTMPSAGDRPLAHNVYFAVRPDAEAAGKLCALAGGRRVDPERLHISLHSLGRHRDLPQRPVAEATTAARTVRMAPFVVAFDRISSWGRGDGALPVVAWADDGVTGVRNLHAALCAALAVRPGASGINPHLTLWRDVRRTPLTFIAPIAWRVRDFVLVDSGRGAGGYEILARFPLAG